MMHEGLMTRTFINIHPRIVARRENLSCALFKLLIETIVLLTFRRGRYLRNDTDYRAISSSPLVANTQHLLILIFRGWFCITETIYQNTRQVSSASSSRSPVVVYLHHANLYTNASPSHIRLYSYVFHNLIVNFSLERTLGQQVVNYASGRDHRAEPRFLYNISLELVIARRSGCSHYQGHIQCCLLLYKLFRFICL